jgi:hypothetical protein
MSTGYDCKFVEVKPGQWYMCLANWKTRETTSDESTIVGPFSTQQEAIRYLDEHEPNPGGYLVLDHEEAKRMRASTLADIVRFARQAPAPRGIVSRASYAPNPYAGMLVKPRRGGKKRHAPGGDSVGKQAAELAKLLRK